MYVVHSPVRNVINNQKIVSVNKLTHVYNSRTCHEWTALGQGKTVPAYRWPLVIGTGERWGVGAKHITHHTSALSLRITTSHIDTEYTQYHVMCAKKLLISEPHIKALARNPLGHDRKSMAAMSVSIRAVCILPHQLDNNVQSLHVTMCSVLPGQHLNRPFPRSMSSQGKHPGCGSRQACRPRRRFRRIDISLTGHYFILKFDLSWSIRTNMGKTEEYFSICNVIVTE